MKTILHVISTAMLVCLLVFPCAARAQTNKDMIWVKGSDTMTLMSSAWAEAFMTIKPDARLAVTGGGSGTGIAALLNGSTDICNSSRDMSAEEKRKAAESGINPVELSVALDGIAIIVNPASPLTEITVEQIAKIYTGESRDWRDLNAGSGKILIYSRETSSGTYVFFQEHVLKRMDFTNEMMMMPASSGIVEGVASDKSAIGYCGLGHALSAGSRVKILPVKADANAPAIAPTEEAIRTGTYPIARALHCYTNGQPKGLIKEFLDFCISDAGQAIVHEQGYVPLK